jgi:hypothetical protein
MICKQLESLELALKMSPGAAAHVLKLTITNYDDLPPGEVMSKDNYQPNLEKRHEQTKTVFAVAPAFLKDEGPVGTCENYKKRLRLSSTLGPTHASSSHAYRKQILSSFQV